MVCKEQCTRSAKMLHNESGIHRELHCLRLASLQRFPVPVNPTAHTPHTLYVHPHPSDTHFPTTTTAHQSYLSGLKACPSQASHQHPPPCSPSSDMVQAQRTGRSVGPWQHQDLAAHSAADEASAAAAAVAATQAAMAPHEGPSGLVGSRASFIAAATGATSAAGVLGLRKGSKGVRATLLLV